MAITISGENNNDRILAQDGVIDQISGINIVGVLTATSFVGDVTGNVTGNLTGNVNSTSPLLLQTGGSERFRITGNNELGIAGANYGSSGQVLTSGGSGSAVSWTTIPTQVTIANNSDNRVITGGSGTNLAAESSFTYNAGSLIASNASGNVTQRLDATSGDAKIVLDNSGNGNYSGIDFERERSSGAGVVGGSIFMLSDTSSNNAYLYLQAQSASAQAPVTSALSNANGVRLILKGGDGIFSVETGSAERLQIASNGEASFSGNTNFGASGSITAAANFTLSSNGLVIVGSSTVIEAKKASNATIQCTETTNNTDLQLRANASGGLVRTATNKALNLGTFQQNRIQITNDGKVQIGLPGSSTSLPGAVEVVNIRAMTDGNLCIRAIGSISGAPSGSGVGIDVLNDANNAVKDLALRGSTVIFKGASAETLRISSDGNIGINDTDPPNFTGYKSLSIHGSTGGALVFGDDGTDEWETYGGDGVFKIYDRAATTTRLHLDGSYGRFGINTNSFSDTSTALSLRNGVSGNDHTILDIICNDNQTARLTFSEDSNSSKGSIRYYYTGDANYMSFYTNGGASTDERLRINSNGSFNIGGTYTGTTHKLQVDNGTTHFKGRVFIRGTMSFNSTPFGANVTYDTGISVNAGGYGGSILAICSRNYGAGTNTQSGVYLLKFHYDGNTGPSVTLIAGTNFATFGKSGSNTLTVSMGPSNNMFTAIESSVVPTT